jgi:hypothetical protein
MMKISLLKLLDECVLSLSSSLHCDKSPCIGEKQNTSDGKKITPGIREKIFYGYKRNI